MTLTILCADDDRNFCRIMARAFQQQGFRVEMAHDGEAALARARELRPALVTLDVMLPRKDGFSVLEALRAKGSPQAATPVILMSGCTFSPHYQERAEKLGANATLQKPVSLERLLGVVGEQLGGAARRMGRPMAGALEGSLTEMHFATLMHHLHGMRASGVLQVQSTRKKKQVQLREGNPIAVKSNLVNETLGHLLVASGRITWDVMHESLARVKRGEGLQGQILKAMHMLDEEDLSRALNKQAEEKLFEIFTWKKGSFRFHKDARLKGGNALALRRATPQLILQASLDRVPLSLVDAWLAERAKKYPTPSESAFFRFQDAELDEEARAFLARFDGRRSLATALRQDESIRRAVYAVLALEMLDLRDAASEAKPVQGTPLFARVRRIEERRRDVQGGEERALRASAEEEAIRAELAAMAERFRDADHFGVLGVPENCTDEAARLSYTDLAKRTHPDRFVGSSDAVIRLAEEVFGRISQAYEVIGERDSRIGYIRDQRGKARDAEEIEEGHRALRAELEFQKGETALRARAYKEALERFRAAREAYPEEGEYHAYYGWALYLADPQAPGRLRQAIETVLEARKLAPDRDKPYLFLGRLYAADDRIKIAEKMFTRAVQLNPDSVEALRELRLIDMRRQRSKGIVQRLLRR